MYYRWNRLADVIMYIDGEEEKVNRIQCHCTRAFVEYVHSNHKGALRLGVGVKDSKL